MEGASGGTPGWLVGFWSSQTLASNPATGYCFCGIRVGPRHVLTVNHGLEHGTTYFGRLMVAATQPQAVERWVEHDELDLALLILKMDLPREPFPPPLFRASDMPRAATIHGVFEGRADSKNIVLGDTDPTHQHQLFTPEQPIGYSGAAVLVDGQLFGVAVRRYETEGLGCLIPLYLFNAWLAKGLEDAAAANSSLAAEIPQPGTYPARLAAVAKWLQTEPELQPLKDAILQAASDVLRKTAADPGQALAWLARYETRHNPIAGHYLIGRALLNCRRPMGQLYGELVAPRVADLFAAMVGARFDCDCTVLPPDLAGPTAGELVRRTPFGDISLTAMLAAQLFNGQLHFEPTAQGTWRPKWVFELCPPAHGEKVQDAWYREAYRRLVGVDNRQSLGRQAASEPLSKQELILLRQAIGRRILQDECLVAFVESSARLQLTPTAVSRAQAFSEELDVPVLLQHDRTPTSSPGLRMDLEEFSYYMASFLGEHAACQPADPTQPRSPS